MIIFRPWIALAGFVVGVLSAQAAPAWQRTRWKGEAAWKSISRQGVQAVVSEERARLIYFGSDDGKQNLLSAPSPKTLPSPKERSPNWGGHRFWLGPQSRWSWPPPKDWEFSAASSIEVQGGALHVRLAHALTAFPQVERDYAWEDERLRCTVRWQGGERPSYAMHVVAIEIPAVFEVALQPSEQTPHGLVQVNGDKPNATSPLPHPAVEVSGNRGVIRSGIATGKFGLTSQSLQVARGDRMLILHPGPFNGTAAEPPDFGFLTQIWVGGKGSTFCELEQLTPYLSPAEDGWCGSTVYLESQGHVPH